MKKEILEKFSLYGQCIFKTGFSQRIVDRKGALLKLNFEKINLYDLDICNDPITFSNEGAYYKDEEGYYYLDYDVFSIKHIYYKISSIEVLEKDLALRNGNYKIDNNGFYFQIDNEKYTFLIPERLYRLYQYFWDYKNEFLLDIKDPKLNKISAGLADLILFYAEDDDSAKLLFYEITNQI